jgi:uncharacterized protein YndB with AHSA1/START domain
MQIEPIRHSVTVPIAAAEAFLLFTGNMQKWWPCEAVGIKPHVAIVLEPYPDGRWYEVDEDGLETNWGRVLEWQSPHRLLLGWQLDANFAYHPQLITEVEICFTALDDGATQIVLEHRRLERFAERAVEVRGALDGGWPGVLSGFAEMVAADQNSEAEHG